MKSIEAQYDMNPEELEEIMRDTHAKIRMRAQQMAHAHFYCDDDDDTPWEPFACYPTNWVIDQMQDLEDIVYYAMLWAREQ